MDLFEAIAKRHSYRRTFEDIPVPQEVLRQIVESGLKAPSSKNAQTTQFVIVDDPDKVKEIAALGTRNKAICDAKAFIVCVIDKNPDATYEGFSFQVEDCAAAVENMLLAVTALGYATVWIDGWLRINQHAEKIAQILSVPDNKQVRILLPIGVPNETYQQPEKLPFEKRAWFNRYGE